MLLQKNIRQLFSKLPVLDLSNYLEGGDTQAIAKNMREACKESGFFYIKNHGVPEQLQKQMQISMNEFFNLPLERKKEIHISQSGKTWRGYFQFGYESTVDSIDQKEGIWYGRELPKEHPQITRNTPLHGPNPFPRNLPTFRRNILAWLSEMERVGLILATALAESLGLSKDYFIKSCCSDHMGTLGLMHYPEVTRKDTWGVGEHTDYGFLTILMQFQPGLEARNRKNQWVDVQPLPNTFVINIGDIIEKMTNGLYKSTPHRARNVKPGSRYSVPYFFDPNWSTKLQTLELSIDKSEVEIMEAARNYKRWDQVDLTRADGTWGQYNMRKLANAFPKKTPFEWTRAFK